MREAEIFGVGIKPHGTLHPILECLHLGPDFASDSRVMAHWLGPCHFHRKLWVLNSWLFVWSAPGIAMTDWKSVWLYLSLSFLVCVCVCLSFKRIVWKPAMKYLSPQLEWLLLKRQNNNNDNNASKCHTLLMGMQTSTAIVPKVCGLLAQWHSGISCHL